MTVVYTESNRHFTVAVFVGLIFFARPTVTTDISGEYAADRAGWYGPGDWPGMKVNAEVRGWCERALHELGGRPGEI